MSTIPDETKPSRAIYLEGPVLRQLPLGFASGLPILLVFSTLSAWLKEVEVSKTAIGFVSLVSAAYALKMWWSPLVDRMPLPGLTRMLGRRRSWMLLSQLALVVSIVGMATTNPSTIDGLRLTILWAVIVAFSSATQDIVLDAYRVDSLEERQLGAGSAVFVGGYRIGMLVAGAGAFYVADYFGWLAAYAAMAGCMAVGLVTTLLSPEPSERVASDGGDDIESAMPHVASLRGPAALRAGISGALGWLLLPADDPRTDPLSRFRRWLEGAFVSPLLQFGSNPAWFAILLFVALYKYSDALLGVMANPFYLEIGFSKSEIATVSKVYGVVMTLAGTALGGWFVARFGILRALLIGGVAQAASNLVFAWQAMIGHSVPALMVTIGIENLTGGIGTAAFVAYLGSLCNVAFTATQYALLSSLMAVGRTIFASGAGLLADSVDWVSFFVLTTTAAIPGMLLLLYLLKVYGLRDAPEVEGST